MTIQQENPAIHLPLDQYGHKYEDHGVTKYAPTEWWWHIGTLKEVGGQQRTFGFEINAANLFSTGLLQISLTDVSKNAHYQKSATITNCPVDWAAYDPSKDWFVKLRDDSDTSITMNAPKSAPTDMKVNASFNDASGTTCSFDLKLKQEGEPLLVWGTGVHVVNSNKTAPLEKNNFYYSLTNLQASGTIKMLKGDSAETIEVEGVTWMDHEYGAFPPNTKWILQDIQLENGVQLSNFAIVKQQLYPGEVLASNASILIGGESYFIPTKLKLSEVEKVDEKYYFMALNIEIDYEELGITANLTVKSLVVDQVFCGPGNADIYEGVASVSGTYNNKAVSGSAWSEQNLISPFTTNPPKTVENGSNVSELVAFTGYYSLANIPGAFVSIDTNIYCSGGNGVKNEQTQVTISYSMDGNLSLSNVYDHTCSFDNNTLKIPNVMELHFSRDFNKGMLTTFSGFIGLTLVSGATPFNPVALDTFSGNYLKLKEGILPSQVLSIEKSQTGLNVYFDFSLGAPGSQLVEIHDYMYNPAMYLLQFAGPDGDACMIMLGTGGGMGLACNIQYEDQDLYAISCIPF